MATSEANTKRRVKTGKSRISGKVCERCGRVLTTTERMLAEVMPPAVCRECTLQELADIERQLAVVGGLRQETWEKMIQQAQHSMLLRRGVAKRA